MKKRIPFLMMTVVLLLSACAPGMVTGTTPTTAAATEAPTMALTEGMSLEGTAELAMAALAEKDLDGLADLVHPERGVRFSPYAYVQEEQLVLMPEQLPGLFESDEVHTWGAYDGSGQPIDLTFSDYYDAFVYSADFANADETAVNERLGQGNTVNNIGEFYPGSSFVEYYISGTDPQYDGLDWQSLRLVFMQEGEQWLLVGIVHDEWTI